MSSKSFVSIQDLTKEYPMGETKVIALDKVSLDIPPKSFTVIMGPSGSGKSTLLYLIGGLDWPTSGSIRVAQDEVEKMDENALALYRRNQVGFIFQSFNLVSTMPAEENVAFPLRFSGIKKSERRERSKLLLERVGLGDRTNHRPTELSGGQQQRVAIARALVNDPPLILADEPTGNLDSHSGFSIMQLLSDLHGQGKTIIVVTHDPRMLQFATHSIYLLDGKVVPEEVYKTTTAKMA
jgi:putative ABC transport system ATP-binding protein